MDFDQARVKGAGLEMKGYQKERKRYSTKVHGYINSRYQIWVRVKNCGFFGLPLARLPLARPRLLPG